MACLVEINIDMNGNDIYWPINLTAYVNGFPPTLREFSACCTDLEISEIPTLSNNIQNLFIQCSNLSEKLGQVISTCFPKLNDLFLRGRVTENIKIDVPTSHLKSLVLESKYNGDPNGFLLNSTSDSQVKYYLGLPLDERIGFSSVKPVTEQELQNRNIMHVICASAKYHQFASTDLQNSDGYD
jgi:hypothetical protein